MFSKLTSNYRNLKNRTKDTILKMSCLIVILIIWAIITSLVLNYYASAATIESTEDSSKVKILNERSEKTQSGDSVIEPEADEIVLDEETMIETENSSLAGGFSDLGEAGDAINEFFYNVADVIGLIEETGRDYSGAPSDVPIDALNRPETEVEETEETETQSETEVLKELKEIDFSSYPYDYDQAVALAQLAWAEGRGLSMREQSLVMWTVLNRIDVGYDGCTDFWSVLTAPYQFAYYLGNPYEEYELRIAIDVLQRYAAEKAGIEDVGRTLPKGYLYYYGDGSHNYFGMNGFGNELWFGLGDPYEDWTR